MNNFPKARITRLIVISVILGNLFLLDWIIFTRLGNNKVSFLTEEVGREPTIILLTPTPVPTLATTPQPTIFNSYPMEVVKTKDIREIYIPLGTGATKSSTWDALEGIEAALDTQKYDSIKEAYFQASIRVPTGNGKVFAKLFNETDKHDVWFSEVTNEGSTAVLKEAKITLTPGSKLYRVYLKSSLEYEAILDFAKIKLIIED